MFVGVYYKMKIVNFWIVISTEVSTTSFFITRSVCDSS
jgi:hypothetical protein